MTDPIPTPVDPARVRAVLAVFGWPWELAEDVIRAADAASSEQHVIEFRADGWTIQHPLSCRPNLFACPVNRAAEHDAAFFGALGGPPFYRGRYECSASDISNNLLIGDRVDQEPREEPS